MSLRLGLGHSGCCCCCGEGGCVLCDAPNGLDANAAPYPVDYSACELATQLALPGLTDPPVNQDLVGQVNDTATGISLQYDPGGTGLTTGPVYEAEGFDGCPCWLFNPATGKDTDNPLLGLARSSTTPFGLAVVFIPTGGNWCLLAPETSGDSAYAWWVLADGANLIVSDGVGGIFYTSALPTTNEAHILVLTIDEAGAASSIRLDGVDLETPGALWSEGTVGNLELTNVGFVETVPLDEVLVLYAAWWDGINWQGD